MPSLLRAQGLRVTIAGLAIVVACISIASVGWVVRCEQANAIPEVPLYPGSILTDQSTTGLGISSTPRVNRQYTAPVSIDEILAFYQQHGTTCESYRFRQQDRVGCYGRTTTAEFTTSFRADQDPGDTTSYGIEIHWDACSWRLNW